MFPFQSNPGSAKLLTLKDLDSEFKFLDWLDFITASLPRGTVISINDEIIIENPEYFKRIELLLASTPDRIVSNYIIWRFVEWSLKFISPDLRSLWAHYHHEKPTCIDLIRKTIPVIASSLYANNFLKNTSESDVDSLFADFEVTADIALGVIPWIDEKTKNTAAEWRFNAPQKFRVAKELNESFISSVYSSLHAYDPTLLGTALKINKFKTDTQLSNLMQSIDADWSKFIDIVNVDTYKPINDFTIAIPATLIQGQLTAANETRVIDYATIVAEFSRFFMIRFLDIQNNGSFGMFWEAKTKENFEKKLSCVFRLYNQFSTEFGNVNGNRTVLDNLVDIGMLRFTHVAFQILGDTEETRLPKLVYNSPRQVFWTRAAQTFCTKYTPDTLERVVREGKTPAKYRVNGAMISLTDFSTDFKCPLGSPMNPSEEKCSEIWTQ